MSKPDNRIWLPDFAQVVDWGNVLRATERVYGDEATWWAQATHGVNYYRAWMPAKHLPGRAQTLDTRDLQEDDRGEVYMPRQKGDSSIWLFPGNDTRAIMMAHLRNQGHKVFVEVDDNYTRLPPMYEGHAGWLVHRDASGEDNHSLEVHKKIVERVADGVICSTPYLADLYSRYNENVFVCRNAVDPEDWPAEPAHQADGILRIGWSGSHSHKFDLADIRLALDWAHRQPNVEVVLFGQDKTLGSLLEVADTHIAWTASLEEYREKLQQIDVMLCPLRENVWANCKSDIKPLEAAMSGACSVVSKVEAFRPWWEGDAPAYVAEKPKDFLRVVKHLVANREEARETAQEARSYALSKRDIRDTVSEWREALSA